MNAKQNNLLKQLSPRENEVINLIMKGLKREEISKQMGISKHTYDGYRKSIRNKLGIKNQMDWLHALSLLNENFNK